MTKTTKTKTITTKVTRAKTTPIKKTTAKTTRTKITQKQGITTTKTFKNEVKLEFWRGEFFLIQIVETGL